MANLSLPPPSRIAIGFIDVQGRRVEVFLNPEWGRYFDSLNTQVTTTGNAVGLPGAPGTTGAAGAAISFTADADPSIEFIPLQGNKGDTGATGATGAAGAAGASGMNGAALFVLHNEPDIPDSIPQGTPAREPVIAPTLLNSWTNLGGGFIGAGYFKDAQGIVHLRGLVTGGTVGAAIFNLPVGYRPATQESFAVQSNNLFGRCDITSAGNVNATAGSNAYFSLCGISFRPD